MAGWPKLSPALVTMGREALSVSRQAWLLRHDALDPVVPRDAKEGDDVVVFLHGLFATAGVLRPLRAAVTRHARVHAATFSYPPGPGVPRLAERLGALLAELPACARVHLVGHSLGGVVARWFVHEVGDARVVQTISLASPFAGVPRARLFGFGGAKDLDESSPLLRRLSLGQDRAPSVPHLSIVAAEDAFVRSPVASALPFGDVVVMRGCGHNALLFDDGTAAVVEERVLAARARAVTPSRSSRSCSAP